MKRTPLTRKTPLRAKSPWRPVHTPLRRESAKRRAERVRRAAVVAEVLERDGGCVGASRVPWVPCRGRLAVHEVAQRSVIPGSHLRPELAVVLCSAHHDWAHEHITEAREVGLIAHSWEVDRG